MSFCPIRSTDEKEVKCNKNCKWNVSRNNKQEQCGLIMNLSIIASKFSIVSGNMETMNEITTQLAYDLNNISKNIKSIEDGVADISGRNY